MKTLMQKTIGKMGSWIIDAVLRTVIGALKTCSADRNKVCIKVALKRSQNRLFLSFIDGFSTIRHRSKDAFIQVSNASK